MSYSKQTEYIQILCNQLGCKDDKGRTLVVDGNLGDNTKAAIRKLPTLKRRYEFNNIAKDEKIAVTHIQNALKINADGVFGRNTEEAVKIFQRNNGLKDDGVIGYSTWIEISSNENNGKKQSYIDVNIGAIVKKATEWMIDLSNNDSHGYDQVYRWGPNYDCSSSIITAWENAGVPVKSSGATYTGNMKSVFIKCGFSDVTSLVNLETGGELKYGDILLNEKYHTAMFIGNNQIVQASLNEMGTSKGGKTGDQNGREIVISNYKNYKYGWDCVLRYNR